MLRYTLRVRDLVHGTILFTEVEEKVINHPFFQRLRQVRQNDVAFFVYPSLNTSRFEHLLGTCRVAGMMAEHLVQSPKWKMYFSELKKETGITSHEQFVELCRLYALLHDIGHLPLSHLFEMAVKSWAANLTKVIEEWTGIAGFKKLHEALGAVIIKRMVPSLKLSKPVESTLIKVMTEKDLPFKHPLSVVKKLIDFDIDADRIDATQRDGFSAGGEYGHYDIRRLCDSVFIEQNGQEGGQDWIVAYSEKALTSMEALLLDRYRMHLWVHFHHRVVAMKMLVGFLIETALKRKLITKDHFSTKNVDVFTLRDDIWLWNILREMNPHGDRTLEMVKRTIFFREKHNTLNLWKTRPGYHALRKRTADEAGVAGFAIEDLDSYCRHLSKRMRIRVLGFEPSFEPISEKKVLLYSEEKKELTGKEIREVSRLIAGLKTLWEDDPQEFYLFVGKNARARKDLLRDRWVKETADWIRTPRLL